MPGVFGWEFHQWEGGDANYWLIVTGPDEEPGINGGLVKRHATHRKSSLR